MVLNGIMVGPSNKLFHLPPCRSVCERAPGKSKADARGVASIARRNPIRSACHNIQSDKIFGPTCLADHDGHPAANLLDLRTCDERVERGGVRFRPGGL